MRASTVSQVLSFGAVASAQGVGDFVASGLGLADTSAASTTDTTSSTIKVSPTNSSVHSASAGTAHPSLSTGGPFANVSVDDCWSSWDSFWSWHHDKTEIQSSIAETVTSTDTQTYGQNATTWGTYTSIIDETRTIDNGGFAISTQTIDTTSRWTDIDSARPTSTVTSLFTWTEWDTFKEKPTTTITRPNCELPKSVSQCQDQWEGFIETVLNKPTPTPPPGCDVGAGFLNGRTIPPCAESYSSVQTSFYDWSMSQRDNLPACTQASIGGALCEDIRDQYVQMKANWFAPPDYATAFFFSAGYLGMFENVTAGDMRPSYYWPTSQTLSPAPSCTVGCGRCAVTGGTVDVLYWPSTAPATDGPAPTAPVTLETLGTTLTSPTIYISYSNAYASNGCSGVGPTITSTIIPIPTTATLSSVYAGTIACDAHFRMTQVWTASASFDLADLDHATVPYSIYSSQPWCQTYLRNQGCQGTCPTDTPYKPIVVVPPEVLRDLRPEWSECFGDIRGAYDPPKALRPADQAAGPTMPDPTSDGGEAPKTTDPATPAGGAGPTTPSPTPTAEPDSQGESGDDGNNGVGQDDGDDSGSDGGNDGGQDSGGDPNSNGGNGGDQEDGSDSTSDGNNGDGQNEGGGSDSDGANSGGQSEGGDPAQNTQDPGEAIVSLLNPSTGGDDSPTPTTKQDVGEALASIINGGNGDSTGGDGGVQDGNGQSGDQQNGSDDGGDQSDAPRPVDDSREGGGDSQDGGSQTGSEDDSSPENGSSGTGDPTSGNSGGGGESSSSGDGPRASTESDSADDTTSPSDSDASIPDTVASIGSAPVTLAPAAPSSGGLSAGIQIAHDGTTTTLSPGSIATINDEQVSVDNNGDLEHGTGSTQSTITVAKADADEAVATLGSETVTFAPATPSGDSSAGVEVAFDGTTTSMMPGAVATVDGVRVSVAGNGDVVYGTGSSKATMDIGAQETAGGSGDESDAIETTGSGGSSPTSTPDASGADAEQAPGNSAGRNSMGALGIAFAMAVVMFSM